MDDLQPVSNAPVRVALILYRDDAAVGGSLRVAQLLGNNLDRSRIEPHFIFAYGGPGPITATSRIPVHFVRAKGPADLGGWIRIRRLIRDLNPAILHFLNPVFWIDLALWEWRGPRINHLHGPLPKRISGLRNRLTYGVFRSTMTRNVCVSKDVEEGALRIGAARKPSLCTIYNAVDCAEYRNLPSSRDGRDQLGLPQGPYLLGMICRLVPEKGCLDGIRLLNHLPPDCHLVICGTGPLQEQLRQSAEANGLGTRVHLLGSRDSVRPVYAAIDNLLFLSRTEPFGLVIAEAMASGVPVIGIAGEGGYSDPDYPLVTSDNALLLRSDQLLAWDEPIPDRILLSLAEAVIELRKSHRERRSMAQKAQEWVHQRFDITRQAEEIAELYELSLLSSIWR